MDKIKTMQGYLNDYMDYKAMQGCVPGTLVTTRIYVRQFLHYVQDQGRLNITDIIIDDIEVYRRHLTNIRKPDNKALSPNTVADKLIRVRGFFRYLIQEGLIYVDPTKNIIIPKRPKILPRSILSEDEIIRLIEQADVTTPTGFRNRTILELLYSTGIRRRELLNLNLNDVDIQQSLLRIEKGKGSKDRIVPIGCMTCKFVREYIRTCRPWLNERRHTRALFLGKQGQRLKGQAINAIIKRCHRKADIQKKVTTHSLRHTCATHMIKNGADIRYVQSLLGHERLSTTEIYTQVVKNDLKRMIKKHHPRGKTR